MTCIDVVFQLNLGPLTYRCPRELEDVIQPGMLVSAPLKNRLAKGIVLRRNDVPPPGDIKEIDRIDCPEPLFRKAMLKLISWMSDYYLISEGLILKQSFPKEIFRRTKSRTPADLPGQEPHDFPPISAPERSGLLDFASQPGYRTMLVHAPSNWHEYAVAAILLERLKNVVVLFPEISQADFFYHAVRRRYGRRICIIHSGLSSGRRSETIDGIISGAHDIVIGTRSALFASLRKPSLIIVVREHSSSYRPDEGLRFNVRDTAVMRGFFEKVPVVMTTAAPSIESSFNVRSGKYAFLKIPSTAMPRIRIIDMRHSAKIRPYLSKAVVDSTKRCIEREERAIFVINRRGYSTLLRCSECGSSEKCTACGVPLVLHKDRDILRCHYCGAVRTVPELCSQCGSAGLELLGAGTEKLADDIHDLFGIRPVRVDSDTAKKRSRIGDLMDDAASASSKVIVGTRMLAGRLGKRESFSLAALLNIDASLGVPDFRARERAFSDVVSIRSFVEPRGEILIQSRFPRDMFFTHLRNNDYEAFSSEELAMRKALNFPPYARLVSISFSGKADLTAEITAVLRESGNDVEILGPMERKTKNGSVEYSILLKHRERKVLHAAARSVLARLSNIKDAEIRIDVDPY